MCVLIVCSTDSFDLVLLKLRMLSVGHTLVPSAPILLCVAKNYITLSVLSLSWVMPISFVCLLRDEKLYKARGKNK